MAKIKNIPNKLEKIINKVYNPFIAVAENAIYYSLLFNIPKYLPEKYSPFMAIGFLPIADYVLCDGTTRLLENTPIYKLKI